MAAPCSIRAAEVVMSQRFKDILAMCEYVERQIVENNGEITTELNELWDFSKQALPEKVDSCAAFIRRIKYHIDYRKNEAETHTRVQKSLSNMIKNMTESMKLAMVERGISEVQGNKERVQLSKCVQSLEITGPVPKEYLIQVTEYVPDKERIKRDLESGIKIDNCFLTGGKRINFYTRKDI